MMKSALCGKLDPLLKDPLFETLKRTGMNFNTLHIRSFNEQRHSQMLAWLLDPNEAHGLGDRFLRRLLLECLNAGSEARENLEEISVSDLQAYSMNQALVFTEVETNGYGRVDILVVEPSLGIVAVIENKYGAGETDTQLERYRKWTEKTFEGYSQVHVVLDAYERVIPAPKSSWIGLSYDWVADFLDTVVSYQELHPRILYMLQDYRSYIKDEEYDEWNQYQHDLIVDLYEKYQPILTDNSIRKELELHLFGSSYAWKVLGKSEWTPEEGQNEIWILYRYWSVFAALMSIDRLEPVKQLLLEQDPDGEVQVRKNYLCYLPSQISQRGFEGSERWPLYFEIHVENKGEGEDREMLEPRLIFRFSYTEGDQEELLRKIAEKYHKENYQKSGTVRFEPSEKNDINYLCRNIQSHVDELAARMDKVTPG